MADTGDTITDYAELRVKTTASPVTVHGLVFGDSVDREFARRQILDFKWADEAERDAQIDMTAGDEGFLETTQITYKYDGTAWKAWASLKPIPFTPTWTNLDIGNGTQSMSYTLASGRVYCTGFITLGSTTTVGTSPKMALPLAANAYITGAPLGGAHRYLGSVILEDSSVPLTVQGSIYTQVTSSVVYAELVALAASGTYTNANAISSTVPFTWTTGDFMTFDFAYMAD